MKKYLHILIFAVILLFSVSIPADAARTLYVNDAGSELSGPLTEAYAVGADGTAKLTVSRAYALTGSGLKALDEEDNSGGGGLLYDNGSVSVPSNRLKVGLRYYYSDARDAVMDQTYRSMDVAHLENAVGSGYAFGYIDGNRNFVQFDEDAVTSVRHIYMKLIREPAAVQDTEAGIETEGETDAGSDTEKIVGLGVYAYDTNELLYSVETADKNNYFAIHPLCDTGDAVTWFAQRRYYGDFAYADLGNGKLTVVNIVDMEHYLMGVCAIEMGSGFPVEALKAQAVAARSYAMYNVLHSGYMSRCGFDLTGDTYSQAYIGYTEYANIISAVRETENQYLTYNGQIIDALYFAADGGETVDSEVKFSNALPYLRGVTDPYEAAAWTGGVRGHQVGMSQWGAYAMARYYGKDYKEILGFYYTRVGISYGY